MASQLRFTCVPAGINGNKAALDVLVSPQFDTDAEIQAMKGWIEFLQHNAGAFQLAVPGQSNIGLTLDASRLVSGLWGELFESSMPSVAQARVAATKGNIQFGKDAVYLSSTHRRVNSFYEKQVLKRRPIPGKLGGADLDFLHELHRQAIAQHGQYSPTAPGAKSTQNIQVLNVSASVSKEILEALADVSSRLGQPKSAGASLMDVPIVSMRNTISPKAAVAAMQHLADVSPLVAGQVATPLAISSSIAVPSALPVNTPLQISLSASGGSGSFFWVSQNLPPGLQIDASTGTLSGAPQTAGVYNSRIIVTDKATPSVSADVNLLFTVLPSIGLQIVTQTLPDPAFGVPYRIQLFTSSFKPFPGLSWKVLSGALPYGLSLGPTNGVISGTPQKDPAVIPPANPVVFSVQVADNAGHMATASFSVTVRGATQSVPQVAIPQGALNTPYQADVSALTNRNGNWTRISGKLPQGLSLSSSGIISGSPTQSGASTLRLQVRDPQHTTDVFTCDLTLTILGRRNMAVTSLPDGAEGQPYYATVVSHVSIPCYWTATSLPAGLKLDAYTGILTGTPTAPTQIGPGRLGPLTFTLTGIDAAGLPAARATLSLLVQPAAPLAFLASSVPSAPVGYFYSTQLQATAPVSQWELKSPLPQGWTLNLTTGVLSGIATSAAVQNFTVLAHPVSGAPVSFHIALDIQQHLLEHVHRLSSNGRKKKAGNLQNAQQSNSMVFGFNQRIALLHSMPGLMDALGLVLHFTFDVPLTGMPAQPIDFSNLAVQLVMNAPPPLPLPTPTTPRTASTKDFWPIPVAGSSQFAANGWINPADGYGIGCLQVDAEASKLTQFGNRAGLRKDVATSRQVSTSTDHALVLSYDEDVVYPLLPPSPITGGLQVWQDNRQQSVASRAVQAQAASAAVSASTVFYADDLLSAIAVNVFRQDTKEWYALTERHEHYTVNEKTIDLPHCVRGVRIAATSPKDRAQGTFDVDEMVFSWRLGSLVALPGIPRQTRGTQKRPSKQVIPWQDFHASYSARKTPSPLFGLTYSVAMRPVFISGAVRPFDGAQAAAQAGLQLTYGRYELIEGPAFIPVNYGLHLFTNDETRTRLIVSSKLDQNLNPKAYTTSSIRVLVPASVSAEVARRHGKSEGQIATGATVFSLTNGDLPTQIPPPKGSTGKHIPYLPDPLSTGATFTLTDLANNIVGNPVSIDFYDSNTTWPNYIVHLVELQPGGKGEVASLKVTPPQVAPQAFPFLSRSSVKVVCKIPPGTTMLLVVQPKLSQDTLKQHVLSGKTALGASPSLSDLAGSDICRPSVLRLTHAVDRPTAEPTMTLLDATALKLPAPLPACPPPTYSFTRTAANTFPLTVSAEPQSTAKVEVVAAWADQVDDPKQPRPNTVNPPPVTTAQLAEFSIAKKHTDSPPAQNVRLPFSDARFRRVTFTAKGYSRLGASFYGPDRMLSSDSRPEQYVVDFLATAAPQTPDIEAVLPNLRWAIAKDRRVRTMGLTVLINRPWFSSGNDERLAILGGKANNSGNPCGLHTEYAKQAALDENAVSAWGFMADWQSAGANYFNQPNVSDTIDLLPDDNTVASDPNDTQPDTGGTVTVGGVTYEAAFYKPRFNQQDGQWYVNVSCENPPAYGATVRLIVARHQKHALPGCEVSPTTVCDFCLLSPERSVLIQRSGIFQRTVTISIQGVAPFDSTGKLLTKIEVFMTENEHTDFDWDAEQPIDPDSGFKPSGTTLWRKTYDQAFLDMPTFVIRESEVYPTAEDPTKFQSRYVYLDGFTLNHPL